MRNVSSKIFHYANRQRKGKKDDEERQPAFQIFCMEAKITAVTIAYCFVQIIYSLRAVNSMFNADQRHSRPHGESYILL